MTKTRTLRESSERLSERYKFKRTLSSPPNVTTAFRERDERINRVSPVKDVAILEPVFFEPLEVAKAIEAGDTVEMSQPRVNITKENTNWPFRIEYIEQLLDVTGVWIVIADGRNPNRSYRKTIGIEQYDDAHGICLDLVHIEKPNIVTGEVRPIGEGRKPLRTERELRSLEKPRPRMIRSVEQVWLQGGRPDQVIDLFLCNILPKRLAMYNCAFYNRDVAHLYLESLSEHLKKCADAQSPYNR